MEIFGNVSKIMLYFAGVQLIAAAIWFNPAMSFVAKVIIAPAVVAVLALGIMENFRLKLEIPRADAGFVALPCRDWGKTLVVALAGAIFCLLMAVAIVWLLPRLWPSLNKVNLKSWIALIREYKHMSPCSKNLLMIFSLLCYASAEEFLLRGLLLQYFKRHMVLVMLWR